MIPFNRFSNNGKSIYYMPIWKNIEYIRMRWDFLTLLYPCKKDLHIRQANQGSQKLAWTLVSWKYLDFPEICQFLSALYLGLQLNS